METVILVSPKFGISQIVGMRNSLVSVRCLSVDMAVYEGPLQCDLALQPVPLAEIEQVTEVSATREDEISRCVRISIPALPEQQLVLSMEDRDAEELVLVLLGYYRLLTGRLLTVHQERELQPAGKAKGNAAEPQRMLICALE